jgi:hypothetical protein
MSVAAETVALFAVVVGQVSEQALCTQNLMNMMYDQHVQ